MVARAESGAIDGLTLTAPLEERRKTFTFTRPFFTIHDFVYLRTGDRPGREIRAGMDELRGKRIGYLKGTLRISRELAARRDIVAVAADSYAALAERLLHGDIDAAIASYSFEHWRAGNGVVGFGSARIVRETEARMVMTIRNDRSTLVGILDKGLATLGRDDLEPIYRRWFGADYLARTGAFGAAFTPEERRWLAAHPVVRVGIDPARAPVEFVDPNGAPRGMTIALLDRFAAMTGSRFDVVPDLTWTEAVRRLRERELDLLPAVAVTPERHRYMAFTEPYLSFPAAIFSAAEVAYLGGLEALRDRRVAVVRSEAVYPWLEREWPNLVLVPFEDTRQALRSVAAGESYAFVGNLVTTSYYIGQAGHARIKVAGETPFVYRVGMGVRSDWPLLADILQKAIDAVPPAERDAIYRDWIAIRYEHRVDPTLLWILGAIAAAILVVVFAERTYRVRAANVHLRRLAREISLVEEHERRRLATELHDSPMQKLALAQMQLGAGGRGAAGQDPRTGAGLDLMREALDELRSLQFELCPPMLHRDGLTPALRWLATHASTRLGLNCEFRGGNPGPGRLSEDRATVLFRCARELVYNAAKHASARSAAIELEETESAIVVTVSDDGDGLPAAKAARAGSDGGGFGLASVREQVALWGGEFTIASDDRGTRARLRMPRAAPASAPIGQRGRAGTEPERAA